MKYLRAIFRYVLFVGFTLGIYGIWLVSGVFISNKLFWRQVIFRNWARGFVKISRMKIEVIGTPPSPPFSSSAII